MSLIRDTVYVAVLVTTSPVWGYRLWRSGKWRTDWPGRLGHCHTPEPDGRSTLLIHAVSVGEINAIQKLVEHLDQHYHDTVKVVVSTTTDSGTARAKQLFEPKHAVVRFPLDMGPCVKRFLDTVKPHLVALTELEVWPNFVDQCSQRSVPVCVINGRLSTRSFRWYRRIAPLVRSSFRQLALVATQTESYAKRFVAMGVPENHIRVIDTMKWDTATDLQTNKQSHTSVHDPVTNHDDLANALACAMGIDPDRPIVVAGSTGPGEEQMLMEACPQEVQLVLAPRKPERFEQVAALDRHMVRRSQHRDPSVPIKPGSHCFLLDTIGELTQAYALADIAIIGRSFLGQHGSNPIEPVALGIATIIGPHHEDFADIVHYLKAAGGIVVTDRPWQAAQALLGNRQQCETLAQCGRDVILEHQGATEKHADLLVNLMASSVSTVKK